MALRRSLLQRALSLRSATLSTPGSVAAAAESAQVGANILPPLPPPPPPPAQWPLTFAMVLRQFMA